MRRSQVPTSVHVAGKQSAQVTSAALGDITEAHVLGDITEAHAPLQSATTRHPFFQTVCTVADVACAQHAHFVSQPCRTENCIAQGTVPMW